MAHNGTKTTPTPEGMPLGHPHAAGIDVGAEEHGVWVPADRASQPIQTVRALPCDVHRRADWLTTCRRTTGGMASTGVSWLPLFQILEARGCAVALVNARHATKVPGRPHTARCAGRGLHKLPRYGLRAPAVRPPEHLCQLRSLLRHRDPLLQMLVPHLQQRHKALEQMQLHLHHVLSDLPGVTGMRRLRALVAGERAPQT